MKSRRVLQTVVAVLSITLLACMLLLGALLIVADQLNIKQLANFSGTFSDGLAKIASTYFTFYAVVPLVAFGVPALLLLGGVLLLLVHKKDKAASDLQRSAGCVVALLGALVWSLFLLVFAKRLFDANALIPAWCVSALVLVLFIVLVACALFVKPKKEEAAAEQEAAQPEAVVEEEIPEVTLELEPSEEIEPAKKVEFTDIPEWDERETPYVPHYGETIHDVVEKTYGVHDGEKLSAVALNKINKVRALYDANAITEQEYIKLIKKYLEY